MSKILPIPTPQDIEAALTDMRDGASVYGKWVRDGAVGETNSLYWVTLIDPDNVEQDCYGGGITSAEAAAVAWINACVCAWWMDGPRLRDEDYIRIPRRVPEGWQFELLQVPGAASVKIH